jgi:hypothetical protein
MDYVELIFQAITVCLLLGTVWALVVKWDRRGPVPRTVPGLLAVVLAISSAWAVLLFLSGDSAVYVLVAAVMASLAVWAARMFSLYPSMIGYDPNESDAGQAALKLLVIGWMMMALGCLAAVVVSGDNAFLGGFAVSVVLVLASLGAARIYRNRRIIG